MQDIASRNDVEYLVNNFYKKVLKDDVIGYLFTDVVQLDWEKHMPIMYDFWESILLGKSNYKGNAMLKHIDLNKKESLRPEHFERWLLLWEDTLNKNFSGKKADEALSRARQIAGLIQWKIEQLSL